MAVVAHTFTHFDRHYKKGDEIDDDDELVTLAPHLFEQPDPEPPKRHRNARLGRDRLVDPPEPPAEPAEPAKKDEPKK